MPDPVSVTSLPKLPLPELRASSNSSVARPVSMSAQANAIMYVYGIEISRLCQVSAAAASLYDYIVTLDQEVELIWNQGWSAAKILYFLTRFCGNGMILANTALILVEGLNTYVRWLMFVLQGWTTLIPPWIVQVTMQLRIFAMYERSALVSGAVAICYLIQIAVALAFLLSTHDFIVVAAPLAGRTRCIIQKIPKHIWLTSLFYTCQDFSTDGGQKSSQKCSFGTGGLQIMGSFSVTMTCTLGSRLILNIRHASRQHRLCLDTQEIEYQLRSLAPNPDIGGNPELPREQNIESTHPQEILPDVVEV
ncbi:hypothetical protein JAAARDRAFT_646826 [Jaapia argillacea MUCL 33604]|uniref:DUF6533 domain-containing protein n=1 Tax=Jaapia argillacea MUCL 33604 TaxID=933084 RepID=A0A067Q5Z4_9AGAM|nr:hypothetical protein JAAARDRAFT_646826 [Jaapia argillacea MUCL 33604]